MKTLKFPLIEHAALLIFISYAAVLAALAVTR